MERSAGVVLVKKGEVLLLHYTAGHWDFPKGHLEAGETSEQAALRELKEETGLDGVLLPGFKETIHYFFKREGKTIYKEVTFFIAEAKDGKVMLSDEHIGFEWLPFEKAMEKLTYKTAKDILQKAVKHVKK